MKVLYVSMYLLAVASQGIFSESNDAAFSIASLTDPAKLATLKGERAANPRLQKCVYWLAYAEEQGQNSEGVLD